MKNAELAQFLVSYSAFLFGDPYGGLPFPTYGVSLGKEKRSRIDARIFPNPFGRTLNPFIFKGFSVYCPNAVPNIYKEDFSLFLI